MASIDRGATTKRGDFTGWAEATNPGTDLAGWGRLWDFDLNKADLKHEHKTVLNEVGKFLEENPGYFCRVMGLASRSGSRDFNKRVSDLRAFNVHGYLSVFKGVKIEQLVSTNGDLYHAFGEDAWDPKRYVDGGQKGYVEKGFHRMVVLIVWKHNHPTKAEEIEMLNYYKETEPSATP